MKERSKLIYRVLAREQRRNVYQVSSDDLWSILQKEEKFSKLFSNQEEMDEAVVSMQDSNKVILTDDKEIHLI